VRVDKRPSGSYSELNICFLPNTNASILVCAVHFAGVNHLSVRSACGVHSGSQN
jgi:hypothetical protein